jgi:uncharacterized membrane protein YbhN (UPF0104 family)
VWNPLTPELRYRRSEHVNTTPRDLLAHVGRRTIVVAGAMTAALVLVVTLPGLLGSDVTAALHHLQTARPIWLWLAALGFLGSLAGAALAWRTALAGIGGRSGPVEAGARYGVGSLVNSVAPARLGDVVRVALFSRTLPGEDRVLRTGGVFAAIGAARALVLAAMLIVGFSLGALPLWPVAALAGLGGVAVVLAFVTRRRTPHSHVAHLLDAFRALGREPRRGVRIVAWIVLATLSRIAAAAGIAAALGIHSPVLAALLIVPVIDLAGTMPLTPGNIGVTSGAVTMALQAHGVGLTEALGAGIALHAVETAAGLVFGLTGALLLAQFPTPASRRIAIASVGGLAAAALAAGLATTVVIPLV